MYESNDVDPLLSNLDASSIEAPVSAGGVILLNDREAA